MLWCKKAWYFSGLMFMVAGLVCSTEGMGQETQPSDSQASGLMNHQVAAAEPKVDEWVERLKGQTVVEDAMEGRSDRAAKVDWQHQRMMNKMGHQMQEDMKKETTDGPYNNTAMLHQYGAGGQDYLLASDLKTEPVLTQSGLCPATAPVRHFDVSAINVEITLNQWLDYYPGYMYVLSENIEKV